MSNLSDFLPYLSPNVVFQDKTQDLSNKTLIDPRISLGSSEGQAGQFLMSNGAGLPPGWGSAGYVTLAEHVASSFVSAVVMEAGFTEEYRQYLLVMSDVEVSQNGVSLYIRFKKGGVFLNSNYMGGSFDQNGGNGVVSAIASTARLNAGANRVAADLSISTHGSGPSAIHSLGGVIASSGTPKALVIAGSNSGQGPLEGIQISLSSGNLRGSFAVYGAK